MSVAGLAPKNCVGILFISDDEWRLVALLVTRLAFRPFDNVVWVLSASARGESSTPNTRCCWVLDAT
jgi:hypothetical protein